MGTGRTIMDALDSAVSNLGSWRKESNAALTLVGQSGEEYSFQLYHLGVKFPENLRAVYLFAKKNQDNTYSLLYIGESSRLGLRLSGHEKMALAREQGLSHIGIFQPPPGEDLVAVETDLRRAYPECICNNQ